MGGAQNAKGIHKSSLLPEPGPALWAEELQPERNRIERFLCHLPSPLSTKLVIVLADLEDWKKLALMPSFSAME